MRERSLSLASPHERKGVGRARADARGGAWLLFLVSWRSSLGSSSRSCCFALASGGAFVVALAKAMSVVYTAFLLVVSLRLTQISSALTAIKPIASFTRCDAAPKKRAPVFVSSTTFFRNYPIHNDGPFNLPWKQTDAWLPNIREALLGQN